MTMYGATARTIRDVFPAAARSGTLFPALSPEPPTHA